VSRPSPIATLVLAACALAMACGSEPGAPDIGQSAPATTSGGPSRPVLDEATARRIQDAQQVMLSGLPEQVHATLGDLLERSHVPADAQFVAGSAAYELQRYGEAVERLAAAVRDDPDRYLPNSSALGFAHHKLGDFDAARAAFEAVIEADDEKYKAHYGLGLVALSLGDVDAARTHLERCLELRSTYLKGRFAMARLLEMEGRTDDALAQVSTVVSEWPGHDEALFLMARLLQAQGREDEAEQVMARRNAVYAAKEQLAGLGVQLGTKTDGPLLRLQMVEIQMSIGDVREARQMLASARTLYPDDPALAAAWARLTGYR
jgi:tetratricopeptide (TPR) repeat protein